MEITNMNRHLKTLAPVFGTLFILAAAMPAYAQPQRDPGEVAAEAATHKPAPNVTPAFTTNFQAPASMSLCFTCGGDWPVYAGTVPTPSAASERLGGCSGGFTTIAHIPYLCAR
jgi:hypothetical protein